MSSLLALIIVVLIGLILLALLGWFFRWFRALLGSTVGSTATTAIGLELLDSPIVVVLGLGSLGLPLLGISKEWYINKGYMGYFGLRLLTDLSFIALHNSPPRLATSVTLMPGFSLLIDSRALLSHSM